MRLPLQACVQTLEFIGLEDNEQELVPEETEAVEDDMDFAMF